MSEFAAKYSRYARNYHARNESRIGKAALAITIALVFVIASFIGCDAIDKTAPMHASTESGATALAGPASTSRQEWRKETMPCLYQVDPEWASTPYARRTLGESGCGPTCLSMVYVYLTGKKDLDPVKMGSMAERMGYVEAGATSWLFMSEGARTLGLRATELPADRRTVKQRLEAGCPVIVVVGPGDFTSTGHYIVLCGIDETGKAIIRDPNSETNTKTSWDLDRILRQARNLWAYSM